MCSSDLTDSSLDLSAGNGGPPVVVGKSGSLSSNALKDVIHKGVHDRHGLGRDASVRVDLLQHLVDVDAVAFPPPPLALLVPGTGGLCLAGGLLCSLGCSLFGWHVCRSVDSTEMMVTSLFSFLLYETSRIEMACFESFHLKHALFASGEDSRPLIGQRLQFLQPRTNHSGPGVFPPFLAVF